MSNVEVNIMRSDGKTFNIDGSLFKIFSDGLNGLDTTRYDFFQSSNYSGNGTMFTGQRALPREITIRANLISKNYLSVARELAIEFFNPEYDFNIYISYLDKLRLVKGKLIGFSLPNLNINRVTALELTFLSESPYLLSNDIKTVLLSTSNPLFEFPYVSTTTDGFEFGEILGSIKNIENNGDFECGFIVEIEAAGEATEITININNKTVTYKGTLQAGDTLILDFDNIPIKVSKNGVNDIKNLDRNSDISEMILKTGNNTVNYSSLSGTSFLKVYISYYEKYNGI